MPATRVSPDRPLLRVIRVAAVFAGVVSVLAWLTAPVLQKEWQAHLEGELTGFEDRCGRTPDAECLEGYERLCTRGLGRACRRLAEAHRCAWGTPAAPHRAIELYAEACARDDQRGCEVVATLISDPPQGHPVPDVQRTDVRMMALHEAARSGHLETVQTLRERWSLDASNTVELAFLDAALAADRGDFETARALARRVANEAADAAEPQVLLRYIELLAVPGTPRIEAMARAWTDSGAPDLNGTRFLPLRQMAPEPLACWAPFLVEPPEASTLGDPGAFTRAVALRPGADVPSEPLLEAALFHARHGELIPRWIAASLLAHEDLPKAWSNKALSAVKDAVDALHAEEPAMLTFSLWKQILEGPPYRALNSDAHVRRELRLRLFQYVESALHEGEVTNAADWAFSTSVGVDLVPSPAGYADEVKRKAERAKGSDREAAKKHLEELAGLMESGDWLVDRYIASSILITASELDGDRSLKDRGLAIRDSGRKYLQMTGVFASLGQWPMPQYARQWRQEVVGDEMGFYARLYEAGAR